MSAKENGKKQEIVKISELSKQYAELSAKIQAAQRIAQRFNINISTAFTFGIEVNVAGSTGSLWKTLCDEIIESEPTADAPVSRKDLEDLFLVFDFTAEEKTRLYEACEINDEKYRNWEAEERRMGAM